MENIKRIIDELGNEKICQIDIYYKNDNGNVDHITFEKGD